MEKGDIPMLKPSKERILNYFIELVKLPSLSRHEKPVAEYIESILDKLKIPYYIDNAGEKIGSNTGNIIAHLKGKGDGPTIMFSAHMDTVGPVGEGVRPQIEGDIVKSDGTTILGSDDKAGIAAILELYTVLVENGVSPSGDIVAAFTISEEIGLLGAKNIDLKGKKIDFAYVIDSSNDPKYIIHRAPSHYELYFRVYGKAAHAGVNPELGVNAIWVASKMISSFKMGRIDKETTFNIGRISGGRAFNIVPERVEFIGEARSHNEQKIQTLLEDVEKKTENIAKENKAKVDFKKIEGFKAYHIKESEPVVKFIISAYNRLGMEYELTFTNGGSDANVFNKMGIPSLVMSEGTHNPHSLNEWVDINDIVKVSNILLSLSGVY